jgi:uncharacterized membrane protein
MDPLENNIDTRAPLSSRSTLFFVAFVIVVQILLALVIYPLMPARVPTHWDAAGHVNGYGPKWMDTFLFPIINLGIFLLLRLLLNIGPRLGSTNRRTNTVVVDRILASVFLLMLIVQLTVAAQVFGLPVDSLFIISLALSGLFLYMGNYFGKLRRNFWAGIRTPWTLVSDTVWERTHRLGGWLFFVTGMLGIVFSFIPFLRLWGVVGLVLLDAVVLYIYSYLVYRRLEESGRGGPLSPPFNSGA